MTLVDLVKTYVYKTSFCFVKFDDYFCISHVCRAKKGARIKNWAIYFFLTWFLFYPLELARLCPNGDCFQSSTLEPLFYWNRSIKQRGKFSLFINLECYLKAFVHCHLRHHSACWAHHYHLAILCAEQDLKWDSMYMIRQLK